MDEYVGLKKDAPQGFGNFLAKYLFNKVPFRSVNYINGQTENIEEECKGYGDILKKYPTDIVCLGIGEMVILHSMTLMKQILTIVQL